MSDVNSYQKLTFTVSGADGNRVVYILLPEGLKADCLAWMDEASAKYGCTIVTLHGIDWNDDLTPWEAKGVFKKAKDFGGRADDFLGRLTGDYLPHIESILGIDKPERILAGISLSGLFALWASTRCDAFSGIASISGSLWYDGFVEWFGNQRVDAAVKRIFLSIGNREKNSKDSRMATVEDKTRLAASIINGQGKEVFLDINEGTHFSPIIPRLEKALQKLYFME